MRAEDPFVEGSCDTGVEGNHSKTKRVNSEENDQSNTQPHPFNVFVLLSK